jgi:hypothetical protein
MFAICWRGHYDGEMMGIHRWLAAGLMCTVWGCTSRPYTEESVIKAQQTAAPSSAQPSTTVFVPPPPVVAPPANSSAQNYAGINLKHWIAKLSDGGKGVVLEDGSIWEINPGYWSRTTIWAITQEIVVTTGFDPQYPYQLANGVTKEVAPGRYTGGAGSR